MTRSDTVRSGTARGDVDATVATFVQALERGDAATMASVYTPDARLLPPGAEPQTGAGIERFWRAAIDQGVTGGTLETVSLEESGDLAVEEGRYELRAGDETIDRGKYVVVHRRLGDGSWRWGIDVWNSSVAAG
ncbi:YybH family protein [Geodermatophilus sp. SYSU D00758]